MDGRRVIWMLMEIGINMKHPDLFGGTTPVKEEIRSPYKYRKSVMGYRKAKPEEQNRCKNCKHCQIWECRAGRYYKCELIGLSNSEATDVRANGTCNKWEAE